MKRISESSIQAECVKWFNNTYCLKNHTPRLTYFQVPNEVAMMIRGVLQETRLPKNIIDKVIAIISQKLKNMGMRPGTSDMVFVLQEKTLYIEFKTETGYQSPLQKEFEETVTALGHAYYICRSVEQFIEIIEKEVSC